MNPNEEMVLDPGSPGNANGRPRLSDYHNLSRDVARPVRRDKSTPRVDVYYIWTGIWLSTCNSGISLRARYRSLARKLASAWVSSCDSIRALLGRSKQPLGNMAGYTHRMKRGVGICINSGPWHGEACEEYGKSTFLLNHGPKFHCGRCRMAGKVVNETSGLLNDNQVVKEVRVEFNYDFKRDKYAGVAIVKDAGLTGSHLNVFTIFSPLIKTEQRALAVAERTLANLRQCRVLPDGDAAMQAHETTLNIDVDMDQWKADLKKVSVDWEFLSRGTQKVVQNDSGLTPTTPCKEK